MRKRNRLLLLVTLCTLAFCAPVNAVTVSGHISDANGADVANIKVKIMEYDPLNRDDRIEVIVV